MGDGRTGEASLAEESEAAFQRGELNFCLNVRAHHLRSREKAFQAQKMAES